MDIKHLEDEFQVILPNRYKCVLSKVPDLLTQLIDQKSPKMGRPCDAWFLTDIDEIALHNRRERKAWPDMEWTRGRAFQRHLFLIGHDNGDQYALNLRKNRLAHVVRWKHDLPLGIWLPYAITIDGFIKKCAARCE